MRWFVLAGGLSPYTVALWESVAVHPHQRVTLAYVPRPPMSGFEHEPKCYVGERVELVAISSPAEAVSLAAKCLLVPNANVVCMGYSPIYNIALSAVFRVMGKHRLLYVSDTNGVRLVEQCSLSARSSFMLLGKRLLLSSVFDASLDLGFSNSLAHRLQGIARGFDVPVLGVEFPDPLVPVLPRDIAARIESLPRPRLLCVARLAPEKNLSALADAFADARASGLDASLTIVGDGPDRDALSARLRGDSNRIVLAGSVSYAASRAMFGAFDGVVLPSVREPWGIVVVEALGWGLPVLASRESGAALSLAMEAGDAVSLCGTTSQELSMALRDFVVLLERKKQAAASYAPTIRRRFAMPEIAAALVRLPHGPSSP